MAPPPGGVAMVGGVGDGGATSDPKGGVGRVGPGGGGGGEVCCGGDNCTGMSLCIIVLLNPPAKLMDVYSSALGRDLNGVCFSVVFALFIRL